MVDKVREALDETIRCWEAMGKADYDIAESAADRFEHAFYAWIDVFRDWVNRLEPRPDTVEQLLAHELCQEFLEKLPDPLLLNFETEAELIIDKLQRVEEDKYD